MAVALQNLHFEAFLENTKFEVTDDLRDVLKEFATKNIVISENKALSDLLQKYIASEKSTMAGEFGKTPQFYMIYINLVHYYFDLSRSIRIGDFDLFKYVLPKISNLFFQLNQPNYARWLVKYHDSLMQAAETHPGLEEDFQKGYFGVKRTDKRFSKQPIDLTLEQTINADAARRLGGIINFTNPISARQRWAMSHGIRSTIISHIYEETGLQKPQDITAELEPHQIKKNILHRQNFISTCKKFINPFDPELDPEYLFNIYTGKAASKPVEQFLLSIEQAGNEMREAFISECAVDSKRFEKPIKRIKICNFAIEGVRKKVKFSDKVQEVRMQRDLFGRMLGVSIAHNIDIAKDLTYPITPVPMSLCHLDGSICKTDKSSLVKVLEQTVDSAAPSNIDVVIVDGFFVLHLMKDVPGTFGNISKKFVQMITRSNARRIDVVFDQYFSPSIKDYERLQRQGPDLEYTITGPDQPRPIDFIKELRNNKFKEALVNFFIEDLATDEMGPFIGNKTINRNFKQCHSYRVENEKVVTSMDETLSCANHEEADTKIIHHICTIDYDANVVIRCSDTDLLVIMLGNMDHLINNSMHIWMEIGFGNNQRYLDVSELHKNLGQSVSKSLTGFHALTGCDYNSAFYRKGKKRPLEMMKKSAEYQRAFIDLGDPNLNSSESRQSIFWSLEKFVCEMYNVPRQKDVNDARFPIFNKTFKAKAVDEPFKKKFRNYDATNLPPCQSELIPHLLRALYITTIWRNAHLKNPTISSPHNCGWTEVDGKCTFTWFEGDQLPQLVMDVIEIDLADYENDSGEIAEEAESDEGEEDSDEDEPECGNE